MEKSRLTTVLNVNEVHSGRLKRCPNGSHQKTPSLLRREVPRKHFQRCARSGWTTHEVRSVCRRLVFSGEGVTICFGFHLSTIAMRTSILLIGALVAGAAGGYLAGRNTTPNRTQTSSSTNVVAASHQKGRP